MKASRQTIPIPLSQIALALASLFAVNALANPSGATVVSGSAAISQSGTTLIVTNSPNAIVNWQSFSIQANETTRFVQQSASSAILNRVVGADPSQLLGTLQSNGRVFLVNPAGILVGQGARIDVAGLVASTLNISNQDFLAGKLNFQAAPGAGNVVNRGEITTPSGGTVYLLAPNIENSGLIHAPNGEVILAAGQTVQLLDSSAPGVSIEITGQPGNITNLGQILVDAGRIGLQGAVILNQGSLGADSVVSEGGRIFLRASDVTNAGIISASGTSGGEIKINTTASFSQTASGEMRADSTNLGNGGRVVSWSDGDARIDGQLSARGGPNGGNGGYIETSGVRVQIADGIRVTTAAPLGKAGTWLIDPNDYTVAASGGNITGATLGTNLDGGNVTITTATMGTPGGNGDIFVNDAVSWSASSTLTLTAQRNINVNATMVATGNTAGISLAHNGKFTTGNSASITLSGSSPSVTIAGNSYTVVNSLAGLQAIGTTGNYALVSDIAAAGSAALNGGAGFAPIGTYGAGFSGTLDGLGHTINNLTINRPSAQYVGMFGWVSNGAVQNLGLTNVSITGWNSVGGLAGGANTAGAIPLIRNVYTTGTVDAAGLASSGSGYAGGLIGYASGMVLDSAYSAAQVSGAIYVGGLIGGTLNTNTLTNVYATGAVTSREQGSVGGLIGYFDSGFITNAYSTGNVNDAGARGIAGGLIGQNSTGTLSKTYSSGTVTSVASPLPGYAFARAAIGGLIGVNGGPISDSYSTGSVNAPTANYNVGGLVGGNSANITNSYSTGAITVGGSTTFVGGLVGRNSSGTVATSFWDTQTSGQATSAAGIGMNTADMKTQLNFTSATVANNPSNPSWNFTTTWTMADGVTYPLLKTLMVPLTVTASSVSKTYNGLGFSGGGGVSYLGFTGGDTAGVLGGTLTYGGTSQGAVTTGSYAIVPSGYFSTKYLFTYVNGSLTVTPAPLTITANNAGKTYDGIAYAGGNGVGYSGLVNGETAAVLGGTLAYGGSSQGAINVGNYTIAPSGLTSSNYALSFVNGSLSISSATAPPPASPPSVPSVPSAPAVITPADGTASLMASTLITAIAGMRSSLADGYQTALLAAQDAPFVSPPAPLTNEYALQIPSDGSVTIRTDIAAIDSTVQHAGPGTRDLSFVCAP
jgi:filamentous hemagglutinin family protein